MTIDPSDWRLVFVEGYRSWTFHLRPYRQLRRDWDHDHCIACSAKLMEEGPAAGAEAEGYSTGPDDPRGSDYEWLCIDCAVELAPVLNWTLAGGPPRP